MSRPPARIDDLFAQAVQHHQAGRLVNAEALYRQILTQDPKHDESLHLLGVLAYQSGRTDIAVELLQRAVALNPANPAFHLNLGVFLRDQNDFDGAALHYSEALRLKPDLAEAHLNLGTLRKEQGKLPEAIANFRAALGLDPHYTEAQVNLGTALSEEGQLEEAIVCFQAALKINPDDREARLALGTALHARAAERSDIVAGDVKAQRHEGVRGQYETLPFPARDPEAERHIMMISVPDTLSKVNQYCFGGARDFAKGLRVLVAGAGTGDSAIWLAHQLRDTPSDIVALDLSAKSLEIAKARAEVRGLQNIRWVNASLLDLPTLGLGTFDYITCLGVLHHLPDPDAGMAALESVLAPDGGMAVMVYGTQGRSFIYGMQDLLRRLSVGLDDRGERLHFARQIVETLPATNQFKFRYDAKSIRDYFLQDNTNFWDVLLHEQDRSYTASEVRTFLAKAGLTVQAFATYLGDEPTCSLQYDLDTYIVDPVQRLRLKALPHSAREDLAEMLDGSLALHTVYAARAPAAALDPMAPHAILSVMSEDARQALNHPAAAGPGIPVSLGSGKIIVWQPTPVTRAFLAGIDGRRTNAEIARSLDAANQLGILEKVEPDMKLMLSLHWLVSRTASGTRWSTVAGYRRMSLPLRYQEPIHLEVAGYKDFGPIL